MSELRGIPGKKLKPEHIEAVKRWLPIGVTEAVTIRALARRMRCSQGAAERRLNRYLRMNESVARRLKSLLVREGKRGPRSTGFYL